MREILKIFTTEDEKELKNNFKAIITEQFRTDVEQCDMYLFDPQKIEDMIHEMYEELLGEIKSEIKQKMIDKVMSTIDI